MADNDLNAPSAPGSGSNRFTHEDTREGFVHATSPAGIIRQTRGAVGTIWSVGGTGYVKRYGYDRCGATSPPPYFPTTGHFTRGQTYWVDPTGFSVGSYFALLTS